MGTIGTCALNLLTKLGTSLTRPIPGSGRAAAANNAVRPPAANLYFECAEG